MINDIASDPALSPDPSNGITRIDSVDEARRLSESYLTRTDTPRMPVKAVYIDRLQLQAMQLLLDSNPGLPGFRIIFAQGTDGKNSTIILGVDEENHDQTDTMYQTASPKSGPCPPMCDADSPITGA